ncbi:hypothetical protein HBI43_063110 [Parastagonospora nodorum]|nr:hypothetical protein HBI74_110660 [Parastagonospora nodorum]KAH5330755.1 hypothetical protein HBI50_071210 [Parastagonospora nodorum]KAH6227569.1 hypothetical protein HBI43_063110 [Parastagonospora nodorum]
MGKYCLRPSTCLVLLSSAYTFTATAILYIPTQCFLHTSFPSFLFQPGWPTMSTNDDSLIQPREPDNHPHSPTSPTKDDTAKPHPHDTQVPSPEQETRSSPRTSFDAFVPTEKLSTWAREDEKVAEQKRTGSLRTRAREKVLGLVGKKRAYGKGGGGG